MTGILVAALVLGVPALAFVLWPLVGARGRSQALLRLPPDRRGELEERKGATLRALRELRFEHEAGHIGDSDYAELRARYEGEAAAVLTELDSLGPAPPTPSPPPGRVRDSRSAWRHPAALASGAMLLLAFGIAIGAGIVRYTEPDRPAGAPTAASTPLTPPPARITGGGGTPGARRAVTPEILQGMLQAARASLFEGRYGEAIAAYQAVLKRDPKNVDALTHLGLIVAIGGHADTALETLDRALAINPTYPPALLYRGQVLYEKKRIRPRRSAPGRNSWPSRPPERTAPASKSSSPTPRHAADRGGRGGGAARPRGSRAHGPSRLGSTPTHEVRIRRGGNGSRPPHPRALLGQRLLGISNDLSYLRGIDRTASPL